MEQRSFVGFLVLKVSTAVSGNVSSPHLIVRSALLYPTDPVFLNQRTATKFNSHVLTNFITAYILPQLQNCCHDYILEFFQALLMSTSSLQFS
jgi:hypothetical protein